MSMWQWLRHPSRFVWIEYGLLGLAIMAPLLLPGFILTLDLVFTPELKWPSQPSNTYVFEALLYVLNIVIPADVIEKIILFLILLLAGVGMHKLVQEARLGQLDHYLRWGAYFAGILYMVNPFTYSRFMAGQYLVLLGYALLPFFVRSLLRLTNQPGWRRALPVALWATVIGAVSIHASGILVLVTFAILGATVWRYRTQITLFALSAGWTAAAAAAVVLLHGFWLLPTLLGHTSISQATASFGQLQPQAFATNEGALGALGNVIRLQGFWLESRDMYLLPQEQLPGWGLVFLAIWVFVGIGIVVLWRRQVYAAMAMSVTLVAATVLAVTPLLLWLGETIPILAGYREPQKFAGLIALAYAFFGAVGVAWAMRKAARHVAAAWCVGGVLLALPILSAPTMLWGFGGQLTPRAYPDDWIAINRQLSNDATATKILFLPWHQYMRFDFAGRIIATPAAKFFHKPMVISDDPEFKDAGPTIPNPQNRQIEQDILQVGPSTGRVGSRLAAMGFSHVLLAKENDHARYSYLDAQTDVRLERETKNLKLYKIITKEQP